MVSESPPSSRQRSCRRPRRIRSSAWNRSRAKASACAAPRLCGGGGALLHGGEAPGLRFTAALEAATLAALMSRGASCRASLQVVAVGETPTLAVPLRLLVGLESPSPLALLFEPVQPVGRKAHGAALDDQNPGPLRPTNSPSRPFSVLLRRVRSRGLTPSTAPARRGAGRRRRRRGGRDVRALLAQPRHALPRLW